MPETLYDKDVRELVLLVQTLEAENGRLRRALAGALCGNVIDPRTSCQLPRGHGGLHAWAAADSDLVIKWG